MSEIDMKLTDFTEHWEKDVDFSIRNVNHLYSEKTPFQQIDFYESDTFGRFFTLDGYLMLTEKDEFHYHEMITSVPMAVNPDIKNVLVVGGGDGGTARELSRYKSIERIDVVEIDERVVRLCEIYIPQTSSVFSEDSRVHLFFCDGVRYLKNLPEKSYDLIIIDSTDPIGPGEGLFTKDFYLDCRKALSEDGILINQHESPYFDKDRIQMQKAHKKLTECFPVAKVYMFHQAVYASGLWLFGFASKKYDPIKDHKPETWTRFGIKTRYYNNALHKACFVLPTYVEKLLE